MKTTEIEFDRRFILPLIDKVKTATTRIHDRFGDIGDRLLVDGGLDWNLQFIITNKHRISIQYLTADEIESEGFKDANEFREYWDSVYGKTEYRFEKNPMVTHITFQMLQQRYLTPVIQRMREERSLF